ncbi:MAG: xylulokinase [Chloroflexi bacterium]|nr:xylulokinase [Chloroflexota bacterium]
MVQQEALLGIDTGTSGTKAIVVADNGVVLATASVDYPLSTPRLGWAEQDPALWVDAAKVAVRRALSQVASVRIRAIGLTGQMHGLVLLDGQDRVLRPAILWCDGRTTAQCREITELIGMERLIQLTCNPALEGFTAPKLLWVREHEPEVFGQVEHVLLPKDYVRFVLTGERATDVSDASGTLLLDVRARRWSTTMLSELGIPECWLARVHESPEITGRLRADVAAELGLEPGVPVVGGGGDQAAGAVGAGIVEPGMVSATIGSSGVVFAHSAAITLDPRGRVHTFCHAVPGAWHVMGVTQGAGISLRWWRDHFAAAETATAVRLGVDPYTFLTGEAARIPAGCEGLIWLPYLMGERTPHLDALARGVLFGVTVRHTRAHVLRAVLEGVVFSLNDSLEVLREMGVPVRSVRVSGGGARSTLWRQIQADVYGLPVDTMQAEEGPAYGAALLGAVGVGLQPSVPEGCRAWVKTESRVEPEARHRRIYQAAFTLYRSLYPALKSLYPQAAALSLDEAPAGTEGC